MKYISTINNVKCLEWELTLSQSFLFELLFFANSWASRETVEGVDYYWVSRNKVLDEIPNAFSTADTVYRAMVVLDKKGVIEHRKLGRKDIVRITDKGKQWFFEPNPDDLKLGKKSELSQNSEKNPSKLGKKSELNSEKNPTDKDTNNNKDTKDKDKYKPQKPDGLSSEVWSDLLELRKQNKSSDSKTTWSRIFNSLSKAQQETNHSLDDIVSYWIMRGWKGFDHSWYVNAVGTNKNIGGNHANNQSTNTASQNHFDKLRAEAAAKYGNSSGIRTVN